jgi:MFS transporter, FSR family, fosmidomycin resistance protein
MHVSNVNLSQPAVGELHQVKRRAFVTSCVAHVLHDGYTDLIYIMLPIWQTQYGIGYAWLGIMRALYLGSLAGLQLPATRLAERFSDKPVLVLGTATAALGYGIAGSSGSLLTLGLALALAGAGSSTQHPIGSGMVSRFYHRSARGPSGVYNFAGDIGKAVLPGATSLLLSALPDRIRISRRRCRDLLGDDRNRNYSSDDSSPRHCLGV